MSHHRCNCCGTLACQQPGPCCEPPPEGNQGYGRCTPRGFVKNPDGSWSGSAPSSIHGVVSARGTFEFFKVVQNFSNSFPGYTSRRRLDFAFSNADPRASFVMGSTDTGNPCREYTGGTDFAIPPEIAGEGEPLDPQFEFADIACTTPEINPIVTVTRILRSEFRYSAKGDLASDFSWGAGGSGGSLGLYRVSIELHECRVELGIGVGRSAGRPPGFTALALCEATVFLGVLSGSPAFEVLRAPEAVAVALTPCGTKVRATVNKPIISTPFSDFGGQIDLMCPTGGGVFNPGDCRVCRAVGIELTVEIDLADLFTACEKCDLVVDTSTCCPTNGGFLPAPSTGATDWLPTPFRFTYSEHAEGQAAPPDNFPYVSDRTMSLTGQLVWDRGCPLAVNTVANGIGEGVATGSVNGVPNPEVRFDVRVQAQIGPTPGSGFTYPVTPTTRGGLRVIIVTNYFSGGDLVEFDVIFGNDAADSSPLPGGNVASPLRGVCTASYEVSEPVDPGDPAFGTRTKRFSMTVGPLYRCTYPQGGGGGDSLLLSVGGGVGGGGGCGDCEGGYA